MVTGYELLREAGGNRSPSIYNIMPFNDHSGIWLTYGKQNGKLRTNFVANQVFQGGTIETAMDHFIAMKEKEGYRVVRKGLSSVFGNYIRFPSCTMMRNAMTPSRRSYALLYRWKIKPGGCSRVVLRLG